MWILALTLDYLGGERNDLRIGETLSSLTSFSPLLIGLIFSLRVSAQIKARNDEIRKIQSDLTNVERNQQEMLKRIRMETESAEISETKNSEGRR